MHAWHMYVSMNIRDVCVFVYGVSVCMRRVCPTHTYTHTHTGAIGLALEEYSLIRLALTRKSTLYSAVNVLGH